ncbi:MAG TPA: permease prefix domain 1-containing protein [Terracidiphilus sp.]|jgi:putative ABC transport system permease protein
MDIERELRSDLELEEEEQREHGHSPDEARYAARRAFGNPTLIREQTRAIWSWGWLESLTLDLNYGARTLRRTPGFTAIAILVMALGIGANAALFTVVHGVLLKPLPFKDPSRLLMLYEHDHNFPNNNVAGGIYSAWNKENSSFSRMALEQESQVDFSGSGGLLSEILPRAEISWNLFSTLGVRLALGQDFTAADDTASQPPAPSCSVGAFGSGASAATRPS